jgi:hypothetical protein
MSNLSKEEAHELVARISRDDPEWEYRAILNARGFWDVVVFDECGHYLGCINNPHNSDHSLQHLVDERHHVTPGCVDCNRLIPSAGCGTADGCEARP